MQTNLTKLEAHLIAGNGYILVDGAGKEFEIKSVHETCFTVESGIHVKAVQFVKLGTDYFILCHPHSRLTTEIEGIGVPIEQFEIGDEPFNSYEFEFDFGNVKLIKQLVGIAENDIHHDINYLPVPVGKQLEAWHFDTMQLIERGIGKEITLK